MTLSVRRPGRLILICVCLALGCRGALAQSSTAPAPLALELGARAKEAERSMAAGRFSEAAAIYRELVARVPGEAGLLMNLGIALALAGHEREAIAPLERAVTLRPSLTSAWRFLGTSYLALDEPGKAIAPLKHVVTAQPSDPEARERLAQAYTASGRAEEAIPHLRQLTALTPRSAATWYALGEAYNEIAQQALATFDTEPEESPWRTLLLADALADDERLNEAFALYRAVIPQLPMRSVHDAIAGIYEKTGHAEWAATERDRAAAVRRDCVAHKAECEFRAGRFQSAYAATRGRSESAARYWRARSSAELARAAFHQLEKLPPSPELHAFRAAIARSSGRHADSVAEVKAALALAPGDPRLQQELVTSLYLARDYEATVRLLSNQLSHEPPTPDSLFMYGDALLQLQKLDEAVDWLRKAVDLDPRNQDAWASLSRAYVQRGDLAAAIPLLKSSLETDRDGSVHFQLARAYQRVGESEKAAPLLERYQELLRAFQEKQTRKKQLPPIEPPR